MRTTKSLMSAWTRFESKKLEKTVFKYYSEDGFYKEMARHLKNTKVKLSTVQRIDVSLFYRNDTYFSLRLVIKINNGSTLYRTCNLGTYKPCKIKNWIKRLLLL